MFFWLKKDPNYSSTSARSWTIAVHSHTKELLFETLLESFLCLMFNFIGRCVVSESIIVYLEGNSWSLNTTTSFQSVPNLQNKPYFSAMSAGIRVTKGRQRTQSNLNYYRS